MVLDRLTSRERHLALFERYGTLLTDHQRDVLRLYLVEDWSLSEVAQHQETSRAAVHDLVRRSAQALEDHERRLGLLAEERERNAELDAIAADLALLRRRVERTEARLRELRR